MSAWLSAAPVVMLRKRRRDGGAEAMEQGQTTARLTRGQAAGPRARELGQRRDARRAAMRLRQQSVRPTSMVEVCDSADRLEEERRGVFEALNRSGVTRHELDTAWRALHVAERDRRLYEAVHRTSGAKPAGPFCDLTQADDAIQCPALAAALVDAIRQLAGSVTKALNIPDVKRIKGLAKRRQFYIDCTPPALSSSLSAFLSACFRSNADFCAMVLALRVWGEGEPDEIYLCWGSLMAAQLDAEGAVGGQIKHDDIKGLHQCVTVILNLNGDPLGTHIHADENGDFVEGEPTFVMDTPACAFDSGIYHAGTGIPACMVLPESEHTLAGSRFVADRTTLVLAPRGDQAWEDYVIEQQGLLVPPIFVTLKE